MKLDTKRLFNKTIAIVALFCMTIQSTFAGQLNFATVPLFIGASVPPLVMLTVSKDQQLHYKAYTDYADLDGDGLLDTTYKHTINYYGYFDPIKCYNYDTTIVAGSGGPRFVPVALSPGNNKLCDTVAGGRWSGNFLNWIAMSRLDTVRKILYGGFRSSDSATLSVLERSVVPHDAHAWSKYYNGDGSTPEQPAISSLTPYTVNTHYTNAGFGGVATGPAALAGGTLNFTAVAISVCIGDQVKVKVDNNNYVVGRVSAVNTGDCSTVTTGTFSLVVDAALGVVVAGAITPSGTIAGSIVAGFYTAQNMSSAGISFCNVTGKTDGNPASGVSHTSADPPLIRVARGNYAMWANNDVIQCQWRSLAGAAAAFNVLGPGAAGNNNNQGTLSGRATDPAGFTNWAAAAGPIRTNQGLLSGGAAGTSDMIVRVEVCNSSLLGSEKCKQYNQAGVYKPIGLLQDYGDPNLIYFGLITNSYDANKSGGVLRKNTVSLNNEIAADGTFLSPAAGGIISALNKLKMYGYTYNASSGGDYASDGCDVVTATTGSASLNRGDFAEGRCANWGNPISEMFLESVRYFVGNGLTPTAAFVATPAPGASSPGSATAANRDTTMGLVKATWTDPLSAGNYCAPINIVVFNPGFATFDRDQLGGISNLAGIGTNTAVSLTNQVGAAEGVNGHDWFVGNSPSDTSAVCTAKTNVNLGDIYGICPQAPRDQGSYLIAGIANYAHVNRIRSDLTVPAADVKSLKVTTYGVAAASSPNIQIPIGANTVTIMPAARTKDNQVGFGSGGLVDFKVIYQTATEGRFFVQWEVSQQGADYDLDMWGVITYQILGGGTQIKVTTDVVAGAASGPLGFGYVINGTTKDGAHYHSGHRQLGAAANVFPTDPTSITVKNAAGTTLNGGTAISASGGCLVCFSQSDPSGPATGPTSVTYDIGTSTAGLLKDPLYYAAKYGGFIDSNASNTPDIQREWDSRLSNGTPGSDGIPDNFFLVANPLGLESALDRVFISILAQASASSVATNSTSLQTGTTIYQARFNANDWTGQVLAFPVNPDGTIAATPAWDAGQVINGQDFNTGRVIITYNDTATVRDGVPFRWPANPASPAANEISLALVNALNISPGTATNDGRGQQRLNWLRGDPSQEGTSVTAFRGRPVSRLGDIINSNPNFISAPNAGHGDSAYATFRQNFLGRAPMIYVGGNDGMLHAFRASDGQERLAYLPSKVHSKLNQLTSKTYIGSSHRYFVDGSPEISDAFINTPSGNAWRTVLVSGMGAGGQGIFALDITDPTQFTEANAASIALWEFTDSDDPDMGYVFGEPVIRKMANGKWAAIVSAGYNNSEVLSGEVSCTDSTTSPPTSSVVGTPCTTSSTGSAYLYIVYLDGPSGANRSWVLGTDYIKIRAQFTTTDSTGTPNGLAQPLAADVNADGLVDFVYAGDLKGRMWKFDVRSTTASDWAAAANRQVLFTAVDASSNAQPITSKPEGTLHPFGGFMITFGTGKYIESSDPSPTYFTQSFYGIWDKNDANPIGPIGGSTAQTTVTGRNQLLQQTITNVVVGANTFRVVSTNQPNWSTDTTPPIADDSPTRHLGWYMDFPNSTTTGERSVFRPILTAGRLIFTTLIPSVAACQFGGTSFLMVVDPVTGARIDGAVLDTDANGQLNSSDQVSFGTGQVYASGVQSTIGITPTPTIIRTTTGSSSASGSGAQIFGTSGPLVAGAGFLLAYALAAGSSGGNASTMIGLSAAGGRVSWRELVTE